MRELERISKNISSEIEEQLKRIGILHRIFYRYKSIDSIEEKNLRKGYNESEKKMQDVIGIRITLYFFDDTNVVISLIKSLFKKVDEEIDKYDDETFKPTRNNIIFEITDSYLLEFKQIISRFKYPIDDTFEVQIRTVLSEGWHEVEHDLRYKCRNDWENHNDLSRILNGLYATLETGEWAMLNLFDQLAYRNYLSQSWEAMLRNKLRIRFKKKSLRSELIDRLNEDNEVAKKLFRLKREKFLESVVKSKLHIPLTYDNLIYLLNYLELKDDIINRLTPKALHEDFITAFNSEISNQLIEI